MKAVGVVGCGLMGSGIAEVAARAGCTVAVVESDPARARQAASGSPCWSRRRLSAARSPTQAR
jgi:3-hydroxybutyryl-CoA dehydrogenase